nr:immunoglobulin heavy chain junction region [Homo sapiens]
CEGSIHHLQRQQQKL